MIIPVYNVARYLARCLDSVCAQSERSLEIICVNDGSTDRSRAILADYAARDARIRIIDRPNGGLSAARNSGLDVFRGAWVMFVDSDDWVPANAVRGFLQVAEASGAGVVISARYAVDGLTPRDAKSAASPDVPRWKLQRPALKKLVGRRKMQSSAWNKFYRADLVRERRFIEGIYFEDWPFVTELLGDIDAFALVRQPMYVYCRNGDAPSIVRSPFNVKKALSYAEGIRHVTDYFEGHPMRRWAMKRVEIARKMLLKRVRRAGLDVPAGAKKPSLGKRLEKALHALRAAAGAWKCRHAWRDIAPRKIVFNQFQGGGFGCNPKYIALELLKRRQDLDLVWLVKDMDGTSFPEGVRRVAWKSEDAMQELATARVWCANHNLGHFIKNRGLVKKPGQFYMQTWHGSFGIKRCTETLSRREARMLDVFLANGTWEAGLARGWFGPGPAISLTGHPRNDLIVRSAHDARAADAARTRTLLYVPTFRDDGDMSCYLTDFTGVAAALRKRWPGAWRIQARLHPNLRKKGVSLAFTGDVEDVTDAPDIQQLLAEADVVVSDYSSCIFDFALSGRAAFIFAPDREKYEGDRGFYYPLDETPFPVVESVEELEAAIKYFDDAAYRFDLEEFFKAKGSVEDGHAAERAAEMILKALEDAP